MVAMANDDFGDRDRLIRYQLSFFEPIRVV